MTSRDRKHVNEEDKLVFSLRRERGLASSYLSTYFKNSGASTLKI